MSQSKIQFSFIESAAIFIFFLGIIFLFVSRGGTQDRDREVRNAVRYQDVSEIANGLWQLSISSTEYNKRISLIEPGVCDVDANSVSEFGDLLIPDFFESIPQDPSGEEYRFSFDDKRHVIVCSPFGEETDGTQKSISVTR